MELLTMPLMRNSSDYTHPSTSLHSGNKLDEAWCVPRGSCMKFKKLCQVMSLEAEVV